MSNPEPPSAAQVSATLEELENARQRTSFYRESLPAAPQNAPILEPLDLALDVQEAAIDELLISARELVVRAPADSVARWSTDPRAGVPALPALDRESASPRCLRTVHRGRVIHEA